jgi:squalene-associated FAD-dependent desaturase
VAASRIAVVGAGLAGLCAATQLTEAGHTVDVYERSRLLGGRATSFEIDGVEVDNGQHVFLGCCSELIGFIERAGMGAHIKLQPRFDAQVFARDSGHSRLRAAGLPAPWHLLASFAGYRHLKWDSKLRVARALSRAHDAARSSGSFAGWLLRTGQTEDSLRGFWRPFFVPALNAPLDEVSAADAAFVMATAFLSAADSARFGYTTVPLAHIARAAASSLHGVHVNAAITGLEISRDGLRATALQAADGVSIPCDGVILAVTPPQLARFAAVCEHLGVESLDGFAPHTIVDVHLWHDRGPLGFDFAALLDAPVQWIFEKADGYLCASMSAADEWIAKPSASIVEACWREAQGAIDALRGASLVRSAVTRSPDATFTPRASVRRPGPATALANVAIAGSWTDTGWPDTMESAVRSGRAAARHLTHSLGGSLVA